MCVERERKRVNKYNPPELTIPPITIAISLHGQLTSKGKYNYKKIYFDAALLSFWKMMGWVDSGWIIYLQPSHGGGRGGDLSGRTTLSCGVTHSQLSSIFITSHLLFVAAETGRAQSGWHWNASESSGAYMLWVEIGVWCRNNNYGCITANSRPCKQVSCKARGSLCGGSERVCVRVCVDMCTYVCSCARILFQWVGKKIYITSINTRQQLQQQPSFMVRHQLKFALPYWKIKCCTIAV